MSRIAWWQAMALAVALGAFGSLGSASAGPYPNTLLRDQAVSVRVWGQVTNVFPAMGEPSEIMLQQPQKMLDIHIDPSATLTARSAEAQVEGLQSGDFAVVSAHRVNHTLVAYHIVFDVQPFGPIATFTINGAVTRISPDGQRLFVRLDAGGVREILLRKETKYRVDGQSVDTPPLLMHGDVVQVMVRRTLQGLVALAVDLKTSATGAGS